MKKSLRPSAAGRRAAPSGGRPERSGPQSVAGIWFTLVVTPRSGYRNTAARPAN